MNAIRFLPTSVHGVLDYLVGMALIAAPWLFGFASQPLNAWLPHLVVGVVVMLVVLVSQPHPRVASATA